MKGYWLSQKGILNKITDMTSEHLENCIGVLRDAARRREFAKRQMEFPQTVYLKETTIDDFVKGKIREMQTELNTRDKFTIDATLQVKNLPKTVFPLTFSIDQDGFVVFQTPIHRPWIKDRVKYRAEVTRS